MQLTVEEEEEENNQLVFHDVHVCCKDFGGLKTKVLRRTTNTMQIQHRLLDQPQTQLPKAPYRHVETHCNEPEKNLPKYNMFDGCSQKTATRANSSTGACANEMGNKIAPTPNFGERSLGVTHRPEATMRRHTMKPKNLLPRQETSGVIYRIWCSCGQSNFIGETDRLLKTQIARHTAAVQRNNANSEVAAHSTRPGHTFKSDEAEILTRGDNRVRRELLGSWFTGSQSINKCNDLSNPYSVLRLNLAIGSRYLGNA
ncbi:unnamed protein product [Dibothriocephalus latus]|uniref:GIY-YIG domain-containing protein n=1 Tax=Dibothriocephalus latus TaxID=60516 RepID=A0A3P7LA36_DIBLA|nr:unnamed protein product [Dibothriocephalus latus]